MVKLNDELCPRCFVGRLQKGQATFITVLDGKLVTIPGALAYTCDICDYREFDDPVVEWVAEMTEATPEVKLASGLNGKA